MNWKVKSMSALVAALFLFNLFSVIPMSIQHPKEDGVSHVISTELADLSHSTDQNLHDHVEHCGMASCTIALSDFEPASTVIAVQKTLFTSVSKDLDSLHLAPPGRPPSV
jgi:hypothetical protein